MTFAAAREVVQTLTTELAWRLDQGRAPEILDLFADDLQYGVAGALLDRPRLAEQMQARLKAPFSARHLLTNWRVSQADDHQIEATLTALVFKMEQGADGPQTTLLCGDWRLALQRRGEHWLITSLVVQPLTPP